MQGKIWVEGPPPEIHLSKLIRIMSFERQESRMSFERRFNGFLGQNVVSAGVSQKPSFLGETGRKRDRNQTRFLYSRT